MKAAWIFTHLCFERAQYSEAGQVFYLDVSCIRTFTEPPQDGPTGVGAMTQDRELYVGAARAKAGILAGEGLGEPPMWTVGMQDRC